jgi:hypothetical protein
MSTVGQNSRYAKRYQPNTNGKSQDRIGYNGQYQSKTSFLDKYRSKPASYYSAYKDINNR